MLSGPTVERANFLHFYTSIFQGKLEEEMPLLFEHVIRPTR